MTQRHRALTLLLVVVALTAIVGHVCVLPGHVHAASEPKTHDHEQSDADRHESSGDGVHAASCEALRSVSPVSVVPSVIGVLPTTATAPPRSARARRADVPSPAASPPLYLAHRALRI